jgi:hypothetical protein
MGVHDVTPTAVAELLALAAATPQRLAASTARLDDARLSQSPAPDIWSPLVILHHLRACEEVWMHSVHAMLAHPTPTLHEIHPRQWIKTHNPYTALGFADSLRSFTRRREALLITLRALPLDDWMRDGRIDGKPHTVFSHVRRMVLHEDGHCDQIAALLTEG